MVLPNSADYQPLLEERFERRVFTRRSDLSTAIRLAIATEALHAMMSGVWGTITNLANEYSISRPFVYSLAGRLKEAGKFLFGEAAEFAPVTSLRERSIEMMLSLRLDARSSIGAISRIMKRFGFELSATGSISQILSRIGGLLPGTISPEQGLTQYLVFASDEIFSKTTPILVTVDPCSSAIVRIELADSRKAEDWKRHFECLYENGVEAIYLVCDQGQGLSAGHVDGLSDVVRQCDTYHAIAHQLGSWTDRLEKAAYKAIGREHECERKLDSAKSDRVQEKRLVDCEKATEAAQKAVRLYDDFGYLYRCVLGELNVFDSNGNLRNRQQAEEGIQVGLALIEELNHNNITKAVNKTRRALPDLFHYLDVAKKVVTECKELPISEESLKAYCLAWQWRKAVRKAKKSERKKRRKNWNNFTWTLPVVCIRKSWGIFRNKSIPSWIKSFRVRHWWSVSIQLSGPI